MFVDVLLHNFLKGFKFEKDTAVNKSHEKKNNA